MERSIAPVMIRTLMCCGAKVFRITFFINFNVTYTACIQRVTLRSTYVDYVI